MNTNQLIKYAISLPVEDRAMIVDSLLLTLNSPETEIDKKWADVAEARLNDINKGCSIPVTKQEVFNNILKRFK